MAGGSAFRTLRKACGKLRDVMQAAQNRYLEVYACAFEGTTKAGDMKCWY